VTGSDPAKEAQRVLNSLDVDYLEVADLDGQKVLAAAVRIGNTRLIDNVILEGETK
jgi:pantothenate synthetase